jgi:putative addiction module antidote
MKKLKITPVGNSACVILPKETLAKLRVDRGDTLYMTDTANGIELSPYNPEFARQMEVARQVMAENRDVLRKLAK